MKMENLYTPNCIRTQSGIYFNILEPTLDMICIEDIAHALSHQCRFGGHLPRFYSVAQHCVMCAMTMPDDSLKFDALMHDASEAYLLDIPKPYKHLLTNYQQLEDRIMDTIAYRYGFAWPLPTLVKLIDEAMLQIEWDNIMLNKKTIENLQCWSPEYAKERFLQLFYQLHPIH